MPRIVAQEVGHWDKPRFHWWKSSVQQSAVSPRQQPTALPLANPHSDAIYKIW